MTEFKKQWDMEMAMAVLANKDVDGETWSEAVEWLLLYGPPHIQEILSQASAMATNEHFPGLTPSGYGPDGNPLYDVQALAQALNISPEEALQQLREKEKKQETRHLFSADDSQKIQ